MIEIVDVRVYKIRGTDPKKDMSFLARDARQLRPEEIASKLVTFIANFMNDSEFSRRLELNIYPNGALRRIFTEYCERLRTKEYTIDELCKQSKESPTIEHIFAQEPTFDFPNFGFEDNVQYKDRVDTFGNLTLLEKSLNSKVRNMTPNQKVKPELYGTSNFSDARKISAEAANLGGEFVKANVEKRTKELANFCMEHWRI